MITRTREDRPYHLLDGAIPLDDESHMFDRLLGLATDNLLRPLSSCRPEAPFKAKDHIEKPKRLYPATAVECLDVTWLKEQTVEKDIRAEFTKLLTLWGSHTGKNTNELNTTLLRLIEIQENPRERIKELLRVPEYEKGVRDLMMSQDKKGQTRMVAVVAGFITCTDMLVNKEFETVVEGGAEADLVPESLTGAPGTSVNTRARAKRTRHKAIAGAYKGEVVVGCYYLPITMHLKETSPRKFSLSSLLGFGRGASKPALQVGGEPIYIHGGGLAASYDVGGNHIKGDTSRPFGGSSSSRDEGAPQGYKQDEEDLGNLNFAIGRAG